MIDGYGAVRVEQVVNEAGVAKGTFFSHFKDKDALLEIIIAEKINELLTQAEASPLPKSLDAFVTRILPVMRFMTHERFVFDVIIRHSGAMTKKEIGPIAQTFERQIELFAVWISQGPFRKDVPVSILAEGIQALATQCMALNFCAVNGESDMNERLEAYLAAWLLPS